MTERLQCINPACRRSAPKPNFPWATEIVCSKCWRRVPEHLKSTYRSLRKWRKRMEKETLQYGRVLYGDWDALAKSQATNWSRIRDFFQVKPEFPAGLEGFLQEIGFSQKNDEKGAEDD